MQFSFDGVSIFIERYKITLDGSGNGSKTITFEAPFISTPNYLINKHKMDSGSYTASSVSNTGLTINVTASDLVSQDVDVILIAMEKM